jgi:hypothetical protein
MFGGGMLAPSMDDDLFGAIGTEPSEYQRMAEEIVRGARHSLR